MKIAVLSDIHSNIVALEEALKDAKMQDVDEYIVLGDIITDLPFTDEVIDKIRELTPYVIKGNREEYLLNYERTKDDTKWKTMQNKSVSCYYKYLRQDNKEYINSLPENLVLEFEGVKIRAVHGSLYDISELLYFDTPLMDKVFCELKEDVLLYGHNHRIAQYEKRNGKTVVQAGVLGMHNNGIGKSQYTIITCRNGNVEVEPRTILYDKEKLKQRIQANGGLFKEAYCWQNLCYYTIATGEDIRREFCRSAKSDMIKKYDGEAPIVLDSHFDSFDDDVYVKTWHEFEKYFLL